MVSIYSPTLYTFNVSEPYLAMASSELTELPHPVNSSKTASNTATTFFFIVQHSFCDKLACPLCTTHWQN